MPENDVYWVPMREYEEGPFWRQLGRGETADEARQDALDNYEKRHDFRPLPDGDPEPVTDPEILAEVNARDQDGALSGGEA